ncbi:hypothetical protein BDU57DRAFT_582287 [Ampelomyces quisqualis]|uniref:Uncharacterized protein n=1 Tax=Ampelomyces quisqualis TaxID=50730 RepID=A0A6A5Q9B5_AMPQU|nr:hypothetical protein BDU57DRAFT_582287 [Ampelomyces quisqualis]
MVRLFIPEGEGQHALTHRFADPYPTSRKHIFTPFMNVMGGAGITAFLAIVGRSRPGSFLKSTAYLSAATTPYLVLDAYGRREVNRAIFKLDNVEPKPAKLWEKTKGWTVDDMFLGGGILGICLALNSRAFPAVGGWKRILGAVTLGCAVGGYVVGEAFIVPQPDMITVMYGSSQLRDAQYARLENDDKAQQALSRFGKLAFSHHTSLLRKLSTDLFQSVPQAGTSVPAGGAAPALATDLNSVFLQQGTDADISIGLGFRKGELDGPDIDRGYRAYKDSLSTRDKSELEDRLERLKEMLKEKSLDSQYLWFYLVFKERKFYKMQTEDREKELFRRQLQLLDSMAIESSLRVAVLEYYIADVIKRLDQTEQDNRSMSQNALAAKISASEKITPHQMLNFCPDAITDRVREIWSGQKRITGELEQITNMHKDLYFEPGSLEETGLEKCRESYKNMKLNTEATERLLAEFEDLVRAADSGRLNDSKLAGV